MRKTRKPLLIAMCALVAALGVNATYAYLTDSEAVTNTFTVGNVEIGLAETTGEEYEMVPGQEIVKDPKVTVAAGSEDCYVFVEVEALNGAESYLEYPVAADWTPLVDSDENGVADNGIYWRTVLQTDSTREFSVLEGDKVAVIETVDKTMMDALIQKDAGGNLKVDADGNYVFVEELPQLTFTAYAVQKAGFDTAAAAWGATFGA